HQPVQVVEMQFTRKLPVLDLSNVSGDKLETELKHIINEEADLSFDLSQTPIMRARLLRLGDNEHVFLLTLHHIAGDGWSLGILIREWSLLYNAFLNNEQPSLAELSVQYADFAVWQRALFEGEYLDKQLSYWMKQLGDSQAVLRLPFDRHQSVN